MDRRSTADIHQNKSTETSLRTHNGPFNFSDFPTWQVCMLKLGKSSIDMSCQRGCTKSTLRTLRQSQPWHQTSKSKTCLSVKCIASNQSAIHPLKSATPNLKLEEKGTGHTTNRQQINKHGTGFGFSRSLILPNLGYTKEHRTEVWVTQHEVNGLTN